MAATQVWNFFLKENNVSTYVALYAKEVKFHAKSILRWNNALHNSMIFLF